LRNTILFSSVTHYACPTQQSFFFQHKILSECITVESRWAMRIVIRSLRLEISLMVSLISSSVRESSDDVASSNTRSWACEVTPCNRQRCFHPLKLSPAFADQCIKSFIGTGEQRLAGCFVENVQAILIGGFGVYKEEIFPDCSGEQLGILSTKPIFPLKALKSISS